MDDQGDLYLDRSDVGALVEALPGRLSVEHIQEMRQTHERICRELVRSTDEAAVGAQMLDTPEVCRSLFVVADHIASLLPYGVLMKFVPDVLLEALRQAGDEGPPPFPHPSPGLQLSRSAARLYAACAGLGYRPDRLKRDWPKVDSDVRTMIQEFCKEQAGFGSLTWDEPGYEDPRFVFDVMGMAFGDRDPGDMGVEASETDAPELILTAQAGSPRAAALRSLLGFWLDFLERETWYVRRAFFRGLVPLLRQLAISQGGLDQSRPDRWLFMTIDEIRAGSIDDAVVEERRVAYLGDADYLTRHGVRPGRLIEMIEVA